MHPTLFTIGRWSIPTYSVLLDVGLVLGLVLTCSEGRRVLGKGDATLDLGLWALVGGIIGGRIGYVLANFGVFSEDWSRILRIWEGGLSFHGAFLGGLVVAFAFATLQRRHEVRQRTPQRSPELWLYALKLGDVLTLGLALGLTFGWAACLMGGSAYGVVGEGFGYLSLGDQVPRFATQVVGFAYTLVLFAGIWLMGKHWPFTGAAFLLLVLFYFAGMFLLGFARGDESVYLGPWRLGQVVDLALALAAAAALLALWWSPEVEAEEPDADGTQELQTDGPSASTDSDPFEPVPASHSVNGT